MIKSNRRLSSWGKISGRSRRLGRSSWRGWLRITLMDKAGRTSLVEMCINSRMMLDKISGRSRRWLSNLDKTSGRRLNRIRRRKWLNKS